MVMSTSHSFRTLATTWNARRECPPTSKKLSSAPISRTPRTSLQISASLFSTGPSGSLRPTSPPPLHPIPLSTFRSTFPLDVNGIPSSTTYPDGTIYSGNRSLR